MKKNRIQKSLKAFFRRKKPELLIGLVTIFALGIVFGAIVIKKTKKIKTNIQKPYKFTVLSITPTSTDKSRLVPTSTPTPIVLKLADTAGYYIVEPNDSYWTISEKVCGTEEYFESIQNNNNQSPLYVGDKIIVNCEY
jgi:LysM repeat protein